MEKSNEVSIQFDKDGLKKTVQACFPELSPQEGTNKLISFISWIISK